MNNIKIEKEFQKIGDKTIKITKIEGYDYMTNYSFNVGLAQKYGVNESIILSNMIFWIKKNQANEKNYHDGYYWTFNSIKAFVIMFPFWTERQINYILNNLEKKHIIKSGKYNKNKYDHTKWYTIIDNSILQNCQIESKKLSNQFDENVKPIPDINTVNKTHIKTIIDYLNNQANKKFTYTNKSFNKHITARINDGFTVDQIKNVIDYKCKDKYFIDNPQHLNPDTLFRPSNFEKYLNAIPKQETDNFPDEEIVITNNYLDQLKESSSDEQNDTKF